MSLKDFAYLYAQMIRVRTTLLLIIFALIGYVAKSGTVNVDMYFLIVSFGIVNWFVFCSSINDLADVKIDLINLKNESSERPLVKKSAKPNQLKSLAAISLILCLVSSIVASPAVFLASIAACVYGVIYSLKPVKLSHRGIFAPLTLPLVYVFYTFFVGFSAANGSGQEGLWLLLLGMYFCFFGRIILKDYRDVKGDKKYGKLTFTVRYGPKLTAYVSMLGWVLGTTSFALFLNDIYQIAIVLISAGLILFLLNKLANESLLQTQLVLIAAIGRIANVIVWVILLSMVVDARYNFIVPVLIIGFAIMYCALALDAYSSIEQTKHVVKV